MYCFHSSAIDIMVVKFRNVLFGPPPPCSSPFIGVLRCQAIQTEHGPYIAERTQKAVYIVRCLWVLIGAAISNVIM
jgi:hypothetical protein